MSLQILQKSLPPRYQSIVWALEILGRIHEGKKELAEALEFYDKAAAIYQIALPKTHYYVTDIQKTIERARSIHCSETMLCSVSLLSYDYCARLDDKIN